MPEKSSVYAGKCKFLVLMALGVTNQRMPTGPALILIEVESPVSAIQSVQFDSPPHVWRPTLTDRVG